MLTNSNWVPNEDSKTLFSERCWLQGVIVSSIAYGITIPLYPLSFHLLVGEKNRKELKKCFPLLVYIIVAFLLGTLFMCALAISTQKAFIDDRNYPGGPNGFERDNFWIPVSNLGNIAFVLSNWLSDGLLVWRFRVIYQKCRVPLWILMLLPCLMFVGSVSLGIGLLIQLSTTNPYVTNGVNFTLPCLGLTLVLNIVLTIAIVLRLLILRYRTVSALGPRYGRQYISIIAMTIESAALYSIVSFALLILFEVRSAVSQVFLQSLNQVQTIATLLIVFRVAQDKDHTEETAIYVMTAKRSIPSAVLPVESSKIQVAGPSASVMLANYEETAKKASEGL